MKIKVYYRRGFIHRVECTTETLIGRYGGIVGGQGLEYLDSPGIAKALVESCPVTEVVIIGAEPCEAGTARNHYHWYDSSNDHDGIHPQSDIPPEIFELIELPIVGMNKYADTEQAAQSALARAAANYCRQLAGLPLLLRIPSKVENLTQQPGRLEGGPDLTNIQD